MLGDIAEPGDAGGFEGYGWVEAAGDGLVDDGLFLFVEQRDEFFLGADGAVDATVFVVEEAEDGGLFFWRGECYGDGSESVSIEAVKTRADTP